MDTQLIQRFFTELDQEFGRPAEVIITGAAAGALMGHIRPSTDIDFEIRSSASDASDKDRQDMENAVSMVSERMKIAVNFSEDISHWSMIDLLDYRKTARDYKKIGRLKIKILAPEYWTIGKMGRFVELDIIDIKEIIKNKKIKSDKLIKLWAKAIKMSPMSLAKRDFKDHVLYFLSKYGKEVWGKRYDSNKAVQSFLDMIKPDRP
ncbi:MAG: hypothetical protein A3C47_06440 [Omnitrophica bacterium RIFCSPHIGHO2_02_FULL_51_18]|nr:MAG: hypothetical protein A3C47_06440 [Omnitrophica bacterium RIFCSPHIGHO2_02_FULL_51_18]